MDKSLSQILHENGLFAKKSLGQHFLLDINLTTKIAKLADIDENSIIFEIGPGPGGLTPVSYTHLDVYKRQSQWNSKKAS